MFKTIRSGTWFQQECYQPDSKDADPGGAIGKPYETKYQNDDSHPQNDRMALSPTR